MKIDCSKRSIYSYCISTRDFEIVITLLFVNEHLEIILIPAVILVLQIVLFSVFSYLETSIFIRLNAK